MGVDETFQGSDEWYDEVARSRPPKDKPWYHVLVHGASHRTYVAERHLEPDVSGEPIEHAERTASMLSQSNNALRKAYIQPNLILIYAMVGEHDAAMDQIEHLLSVPSSISVPYLRSAQYPGSLRDYARFQKLLARYEN